MNREVLWINSKTVDVTCRTSYEIKEKIYINKICGIHVFQQTSSLMLIPTSVPPPVCDKSTPMAWNDIPQHAPLAAVASLWSPPPQTHTLYCCNRTHTITFEFVFVKGQTTCWGKRVIQDPASLCPPVLACSAITAHQSGNRLCHDGAPSAGRASR